MNALKMCLNWKVITGVAVVTAGLFVFAPSFAAAALPFLVLAICPLSMILMMTMMSSSKGESEDARSTSSTNAGASQQLKNPGEQLATLRAQRENLAFQIAALESEAPRMLGTQRAEASAEARP